MRYFIFSILSIGMLFLPLIAKTTDPIPAPYGKIYLMPNTQFKPDKSMPEHKMVFDLTKGSSSPKEVNPSLDRIARTINLYAAVGISPSVLKIVAVASGDATPLALDNAHYHEKFGVNNPNLALIDDLKKLGVQISVCSQAWAEHDYKPQWVYKNVLLALSGATTLISFQEKGYVLIPL
ncbi:DsrE family protein [Helicobacter sp. 11S03491-1]|uniref:DsrE family protein n=1 Tax=Helicobacter sp. 11S03491-1 TaxID=1476196 RepID=UPI000BA5B8A5|nr:DsrE family protein [Helicobacter sp. 11S03491-1]PAF43847.1 hypothetical protein BKH45_00865 [Helicobacter sp. 11S03491-1]